MKFFSIFSYSARRTIAAALATVVLAAAGPVLCKEKEKAKEDTPINIEADRMVSQEDKGSVVFVGNVDASQGKVTIRTDEMTVYYDQNGQDKTKGKSGKVKRLVCVGNVQVTQEGWLGTGERMDYYADERKVILKGNAKASEGQNMVSSDTITYYLDEKRSVFEQDQGKSGR
ncbi:lipopolysaccharide transport periplasmic protein LptA, partial [Desulfobulbus sp. F4]|nr:lipopolysaccharide transport periplasmic protein LptA [Desulfobulbus sp. F4]